ncbi:hypothetical protein ACIBQX_18580 [Nonomuraea sp. NPDC049714]|uniref:hypothetical protein n=1 Tax=Nonomuraea sp. NPDC049714 TaxID=3364357 RepID=UPI0037933597
MNRFKKVALYVVLAFIGFYLFTRPANAADAVNTVIHGVTAGANQLSVFLTNISL